ncbi:MAG: hypothetical protein FJY26_04910 [Betaproteobacteria bacterium]|nr:hypothetical protein [Betaproteobacteria bacterium]
MFIDKAQTRDLSAALGGLALEVIIRDHAHTCYPGVRDQLHERSRGYGHCPTYELRGHGWQRYRALGAQAAARS